VQAAVLGTAFNSKSSSIILVGETLVNGTNGVADFSAMSVGGPPSSQPYQLQFSLVSATYVYAQPGSFDLFIRSCVTGGKGFRPQNRVALQRRSEYALAFLARMVLQKA
jgi:hypothetical protein